MSGVYVYIDGYNFYYGINKPGWLKYGWCNFSKLAKRFAERAFGSSFPVDEVKYYTAPVRVGWQENKRGESERSKMWLDAIRAETPEVRIIEGRWSKIGNKQRKEKETDVNIAVDMQWDIAKCGRIILVSGDSDFNQQFARSGRQVNRLSYSCLRIQVAINPRQTVAFELKRSKRKT
jgi:uncharacterized LabA/DUF88 family protein